MKEVKSVAAGRRIRAHRWITEMSRFRERQAKDKNASWHGSEFSDYVWTEDPGGFK